MVFEIPLKLPSLNEYVDMCRESRYGANTFKRTLEAAIICHIRKARVRPVTSPVRVRFVWYEATRKRDKDNVSFAKKFILDALQKAGILPKDDNRYIAGFSDEFIYHSGQRVVVELEEKDAENEVRKL